MQDIYDCRQSHWHDLCQHEKTPELPGATVEMATSDALVADQNQSNHQRAQNQSTRDKLITLETFQSGQ